jgi:hypothetical protein
MADLMDRGQSNPKFAPFIEPPVVSVFGAISQPPTTLHPSPPQRQPPPCPLGPQMVLSEGISVSTTMPPSPSVIAVLPPVASPSQRRRPSTPPPKRPGVLPGEDGRAARRGWEKAMVEWMMAHGTSCAPAEKCGPCDRTGTECVRLPGIMKKCAVCFRGHDVCEMWDDTVKNAGRRRTSAKPATPKKVLSHCAGWKVLIGRLFQRGGNRIRL